MPRTLSVEEYKELGKRYYARKDYQRALGAFTDGMDASVGRDIQLYDYRSVIYVKLGDNTSALKDARHMMKAFATDPKGYMRCAQILLGMDDKSKALKIYALGLKHVSATHPDIDALRGAHEKLNLKLCPPKAVDPFTQLPQEIVEMVMSYLKFYELVSCLRVSKQWKLFLESLPNLWRKVDLMRAGGRRNVKPGFLKRVVAMSRNGVKEARIANYGSKPFLMHLVEKCRGLEKLEFMQTTFGSQTILDVAVQARSLKTLVVHADLEIHGDNITQILRHRPSLEELRIMTVGEGCTASKVVTFELPNLKILDLRNVNKTFISMMHFNSLIGFTPNLEELILNELAAEEHMHAAGAQFPLPKFKHLHHLHTLQITTTSFLGFPQANSSRLRDLTFRTPHELRGAEIKRCKYALLETLRLRARISFWLLAALIDAVVEDGCDAQLEPSKLKVFELALRDAVGPEEVSQILRHDRLDDVEELILGDMSAIDFGDRHVGVLTRFRKLRFLKLHSASITGAGIKDLVTQSKVTIQHIQLSACENVSPDAVDWSARQGVNITIMNQNQRSFVRRR